MQPLKPVFVSELFPTLLKELIDLLEGLKKEDWATPTMCGPWSVKDVCLHMLGGDISNLSWKRDGFSVFSEIDSYDHLVQLVNVHNARWVEGTQHFSPRFLIDSLKFTGEQVIDYFQSLDPYALGIPIDWVGPDPAPTWLDLAREYTERWHHQQHIREAIGKPGLKEARFLAPILDTFILAMPRTFQPVEAQGGTAIGIHTQGEVHRDWVLVRENDQWRLYEGTAERQQAAISLPADIAWRVFTKGIPLEDARQHAQTTGDQPLAEKVLETISIIG
jgi:uncharacterized protein (TIGR03083 family)